jgi:hypothetical protein
MKKISTGKSAFDDRLPPVYAIRKLPVALNAELAIAAALIQFDDAFPEAHKRVEIVQLARAMDGTEYLIISLVIQILKESQIAPRLSRYLGASSLKKIYVGLIFDPLLPYERYRVFFPVRYPPVVDALRISSVLQFDNFQHFIAHYTHAVMTTARSSPCLCE